MESVAEVGATQHLRNAATAAKRAGQSLLTGEVPQQLGPVVGEVLTLIDRLPPLVLAVQRCAWSTGSGAPIELADRDDADAPLGRLVASLSGTHSALVAAASDLGRAHTAAARLDGTRR